MTKEEAKIILGQVVTWWHDKLHGHPKLEYIAEAAEIILSEPSLPSELDGAAEEYALDVKAKPFGGLVKDAFKAGAEWQREEDNKKHCFVQLTDIKKAWQKLKEMNQEIEDKPSVCFYKGAEWMAGQGVTVDGKVVMDFSEPADIINRRIIAKLGDALLKVEPGEVIVQIRKQ